MSSRILSQPAFLTWAIVNLASGIWEVYAYLNRVKLKLEYVSLWEKMAKGEITLSNFWIEGWSEYCKVDSRYTKEFSQGGYVWYFELLNAFLAVVFIFSLALEYINIINIILVISIVNCLGYFISLALEAMQCRLESRFARQWQYPTYYLISGIWLIVPYCLWKMVSSR